MYEMITIFSDNTRETTTYKTQEEAEKAKHNYYLVFGNQISYIYIRRS